MPNNIEYYISYARRKCFWSASKFPYPQENFYTEFFQIFEKLFHFHPTLAECVTMLPPVSYGNYFADQLSTPKCLHNLRTAPLFSFPLRIQWKWITTFLMSKTFHVEVHSVFCKSFSWLWINRWKIYPSLVYFDDHSRKPIKSLTNVKKVCFKPNLSTKTFLHQFL